MPRRDSPQAQEGPALPPFRAELRVRVDDPRGWQLLGETLATWLDQRASRRLAVVCIGTDRSTGDALGPLVGTLLGRSGELPADAVVLLGTLDEPVHAGNLDQAIARLATMEPGTTVLAVDACLGRSENVGSISAGRGALQPGAGVNKSLPAVGHLFVTGTVNVGGFMEYFVLQNTRLGLVLRMAEAIGAGIALAARLHFGRHHTAHAAARARVAFPLDLAGAAGADGQPHPGRPAPGRAASTAGRRAGPDAGAYGREGPAGANRGGEGAGVVGGTPSPGSSGELPLTLTLVAASRRSEAGRREPFAQEGTAAATGGGEPSPGSFAAVIPGGG